MHSSFRIVVAVTLGLGLTGCERVRDRFCPAPPEVSPEPAGAAAAPAKEVPEAPEATKPELPRGSEYMLPFAWESSVDEPLGKTRAFLAEALATNNDYVDTAADLLAKLRPEQHPRVTVVACSDSQVQSTAFDASAENDDYVVRNWGNRVGAADETIAYGVERIGSPLLLIVGHTGCSAISEALDEKSKLGEPIRRELAAQRPGDENGGAGKGGSEADHEGAHPSRTPVEAVVANVQHQVDVALERFGARVQAGRLTIVGAVLDLENALHKGRGRLVVVDVNANRDQKRLEAFLEAVNDGEMREPVERSLRRHLH